MNRRNITLAVVLMAGITFGLFGSQVLGAQAEPTQKPPLVNTMLTRHSLMTAEGREAVLIHAEFAPGAAFAGGETMEHGADEFVYVLEGSAVVAREGEAPVTYQAGDSWYNAGSERHTLKNASSSEPLRALIILIGAKDQLPPGN